MESYSEESLLKLTKELDKKLANKEIDIYEAAKEALLFCRAMTEEERCGYNRFASGAAYVLIQREKRKDPDCHPWYLHVDAEKMESVREFFDCPD